jgi:hypothetical protein
MSDSIEQLELAAIRPRLLALLELHRTAASEDQRAVLVSLLEDAFLAAAWQIAQDLLEDGWRPGFVGASSTRPRGDLKVVGGVQSKPSAAKRLALGGARSP